MADWKKVVVSGSAISQLDNDAGYLTAGTLNAPNSFSTASFNGTHIISNSETGSLLFASSSGEGLTIDANAGTDTLTFGLSDIPNSSLENGTFNVGAGNGLTGGGSTALGGTSTVGVGAGTHITVNANDIAVNTTTLIPAVSGTILTTVSGDVSITAQGVATVNGVAANSVALGTDTTGDYVQNLGSGTGVTIGSNSGEGSQPTIAVDYGSSANTAVEGDTTITINGTAGEIGITETPSQALGAAPSYTITLPDTITGDRTFQDNITVTGDLTVEGTASFQSTTNLQVADRFVLFASGSGTTGDGGIVVQQDTQDVGELFGYDSGTTRWGVTSSFSADNSAYTPDAFMAAVTTLASPNPNTSGPDARYDAVGNIYVSSDDESIWIYA